MLHGEFPHEITFQRMESLPDGGGGYEKKWANYITIDGFMGTPSSRERYEAQQLNNPLDRKLYYPYRTDISTDMRVIYGTETYEIAGKPQDLGGQHEIMRIPLKLVNS